jgi:hypothetical protein
VWIYRQTMGDPLLLDLVPRRVMPCGALLGTIQVAQPQDGATEDPLRGTGQSGGRVVCEGSTAACPRLPRSQSWQRATSDWAPRRPAA